MALSNRQKQQALQIRDLLMTQGWKAYEDFLKDLVYDYLNASVPKETLCGIKMAVDEAKKLVLRYENG